MKIIRTNNTTMVVFNNGTMIQRDLTDEEFKSLQQCNDEEDVKVMMYPELQEARNKYKEFQYLEERIKNSSILVKKGDSVYWEAVSQLSMPEELIKAVLDAEENADYNKIDSYFNFWTLMSLNPDSRCRENLFWFLQRYGMKISKYGLFVGYRNADLKSRGEDSIKYSKLFIKNVKDFYEKIKRQKQSPKKYVVKDWGYDNYTLERFQINVDNRQDCLYNLYNYFNTRLWDYDLINLEKEAVYTDHHSHTFTIKIGQKVTMPRKDCDNTQEHTCSTGLHIGGETWLSENYFGDTELICLVNPADVVAVPPQDNYGKLRTCAYLPIGTVKFDEKGKVIPYNLEDGFDSEYVTEVIYNGEKSTEDIATYSYSAPDIPELNREIVTENLMNIAKQAIEDRLIK